MSSNRIIVFHSWASLRLKENHFSNLGEKNVTNNRCSLKKVKPLLADKLIYKKRIKLLENSKNLKTDTEATKAQFSYIV